MSMDEPTLWEKEHPANGGRCPVTGLAGQTYAEWKVNEVDYRFRMAVLERGVLLSLPVGHTKLHNSQRFFEIIQETKSKPNFDPHNFVLVEDYSFHESSDHDARYTYIKNIVEIANPKGVVFFTRSPKWAVPIRLGALMGGFVFPIRIAQSYREALQIASTILGRPLAGAGEISSSYLLNRKHFGLQIQPEERNCWLGSLDGRPTLADIEEINLAYLQNVQSDPRLAPLPCVLDLCNLGIHGFWNRFTWISNLVQQLSKAEVSIWIALKDSILRRLVAFTMRHEKWFHMESELESILRKIPQVTGKSNLPVSEQATLLLSAMDWEVQGFLAPDEFGSDELRPLATMLGAIKTDIDTILLLQQKEMQMLETSISEAEKMSAELENALQLSEKSRFESIRLAEKSDALQSEIEESQEEVFQVLADYIDERGNFPVGNTRILAYLMRETAPWLGFSKAEADALQIAVLLHHVGYLGIPEGKISETSAHCELGKEVLGNLNSVSLPFAAEMSSLHHASWQQLPIYLQWFRVLEIAKENPTKWLKILESTHFEDMDKQLQKTLQERRLELEKLLKNC